MGMSALLYIWCRSRKTGKGESKWRKRSSYWSGTRSFCGHWRGMSPDLKAVQAEIRSMNETLVTLATELKYANAHLTRHDKSWTSSNGVRARGLGSL